MDKAAAFEGAPRTLNRAYHPTTSWWFRHR